jgi:hypothetical protein
LKKANKQECLDITVLRRIFGPKRKEVIGGWRKLRSEELHDFLSTPGIMCSGEGSKTSLERGVYGRDSKCIQPFGGKNRRSGRRRWEESIEMDL